MEKIKEAGHNSFANLKKKAPPTVPIDGKSQESPDYKLSLEKKSKELAQDLKTYGPPKKAVTSNGLSDVPLEKEAISDEAPAVVDTAKVELAKTEIKDKGPAIFFISGFDWFGASSVKGNYDGIRDMAKAVDGAKHFSWDEKQDMHTKIAKLDKNAPLILVGHSFGGDTAVEIANELNTMENDFRKVDLLVTLDSVGFNNDLIPENVKKNVNYIAQGSLFLNDGPNLARKHEKTSVENILMTEAHAELDDLVGVQQRILKEIENLV